MEIIVQANSEILDFLGGLQQYRKDVKYRKSTLILTEPVNSEVIAVYNTLTKFCVYLTNEEWENILDSNMETDSFRCLIESYTLVPEFFKENDVIDQYRKQIQAKKEIEPLKYISSYVILTTTDCNARCFYCYEKGCEKSTMTVETAEKLTDFIISHKDPKSEEPIKLAWFGGEPLYNKEVIDIISNKLNENNINLDCEITSNGILFNEDLAKHAKEVWHINNAQITIDGTQDVYNKVKNYIYKDIKNPYEVVMNNIKHLTDNGIHVAIRLNLGSYNFENLKELVKEIYDKFGTDGRVTPYVHEIFDDPKHPRTAEQTKDVYDKLGQMFEILNEYGYLANEIAGEGIWEHACMADSGYSLLINPTGGIGLCEHYQNEHLIGDIFTFDEKKDWDEYNAWQEKCHYDACDDCPIYPFCYKVKLCGGDYCSVIARDANAIKYKLELRNLIRNHARMEEPVPRREFEMLRMDFSRLFERHESLIEDFSRLFDRVTELENIIKNNKECEEKCN